MRQIHTAVALPAFLLGSLSMLSFGPFSKVGAQGVPPPDPMARLERLHQEVTLLKAEVQRLRVRMAGSNDEGDQADSQNAKMNRDIEQVLAYLRQQSEAAKAMAQTLDTAEEKGFTAGINPDSRTTMLAGWRAQLQAQQTNVPAAGPLQAAAKGAKK